MAAVAEHSHDGMSRAEPPGGLDRGAAMHRSRRADEEPIAIQQGLRHAEAFLVLDAKCVVHLRRGEVGGDAVAADALDDGVIAVASLRALLLL